MAKAVKLIAVNAKGTTISLSKATEKTQFAFRAVTSGFVWSKARHRAQFYRDRIKGREEGSVPLSEFGDDGASKVVVAGTTPGEHVCRVDILEKGKVILTTSITFTIHSSTPVPIPPDPVDP